MAMSDFDEVQTGSTGSAWDSATGAVSSLWDSGKAAVSDVWNKITYTPSNDPINVTIDRDAGARMNAANDAAGAAQAAQAAADAPAQAAPAAAAPTQQGFWNKQNLDKSEADAKKMDAYNEAFNKWDAERRAAAKDGYSPEALRKIDARKPNRDSFGAYGAGSEEERKFRVQTNPSHADEINAQYAK
jgi:hypothetical protein